MEAKKVALQTLEFALDMKSEQQCNRVFERFARWQRSPERQEYWARRQQQTGANRAKASNLAKAAGGFLSVAAGIRAAASLGGTNKVAPAPRPAGQGNDPEAPPPRDSGGCMCRHAACTDNHGTWEARVAHFKELPPSALGPRRTPRCSFGPLPPAVHYRR